GSLLSPYSPYQNSPAVDKPPDIAHPFGTDYLGRDLLTEIVWGSYSSLLVAVVAALGAALLGFFAGVFAGYYSKLEGVLSGTADSILTFPIIPLMILIGVLFIATDELIALLLIAFLWAPVTRAVRAQVASMKRLSYVDAERTSGLGDLSIVMRVLVPEVGAIGVAYFVLNVVFSIAIATALEFLGIGNPNVVSLGSILYWAQQYGFTAGAWWWILAPGLLISLFALGFALIGFSLEEIMNPRLTI
ncbi:MAG: ABC transporter permease, partial [Thaumarchaeota archaeon]|nr:ABC transporter permease [Nitrososphaerota archaeon]